MGEEPSKRCQRVFEFWGFKDRASVCRELTIIPVSKEDKDMKNVGGKYVGAGIIFVKREPALEEEVTHALHERICGEKAVKYGPISEFLAHLTKHILRGEKLSKKEREIYKNIMLRLFQRLAASYAHVHYTKAEINDPKARKMLEEAERNVKEHIKRVVEGRSFSYSEVYRDAYKAYMLACLFMGKEPEEDKIYETLTQPNPELDVHAQHWGYILAEGVADKIRKMPPEKRREFFEKMVYAEFPSYVFNFLKEHAPHPIPKIIKHAYEH